MLTGPVIIFDKSMLQSINADESMWLESFYLTNITPLFFVETLADLEKEVRNGKTPEQIIGSIAHRTPNNSCINVHHKDLIAGELILGRHVEMSGRPIVAGGEVVKLANETGIIFQESPEAIAFRRWQEGKFLEIERNHAKKWREELRSGGKIDYSGFDKLFALLGKPKTFEELMLIVNKLIDSPDQRGAFLLGMKLMGLSQKGQDIALERWDSLKAASIRDFAPYFTFVLSVDIFFHFGSASKLFELFRHPQTHHIDIAYIYYLPFCKVFSSCDKIHINIIPYFLRTDQTFINGNELKKDFTKLNELYSKLPTEILQRGVVSFAPCPPDETEYLTSCLWDKYMAKEWRNLRKNSRKFDGTDKVNPEVEKALFEKLKNFQKNSVPVEPGTEPNSDDLQSMMIKRNIMKTKGKWKKFPPEIENSNKRID